MNLLVNRLTQKHPGLEMSQFPSTNPLSEMIDESLLLRLASSGYNPSESGNVNEQLPISELENMLVRDRTRQALITAQANLLNQNIADQDVNEKLAALLLQRRFQSQQNTINPESNRVQATASLQTQDALGISASASVMPSPYNLQLSSADALAMPNPNLTQLGTSNILASALMLGRQSTSINGSMPLNSKEKDRRGTFPEKLHRMLSDLEHCHGGTEIASFLPHGRAFAIHRPRDFAKHVMQKYFRMSRFSSFQRQLNLYDFQRITEGPDKGAYRHDLFVYGMPMLCVKMKRTKIKGMKRGSSPPSGDHSDCDSKEDESDDVDDPNYSEATETKTEKSHNSETVNEQT